MIQSGNQSKYLIIVTLNYKMLIDIFDLNKKSHDFLKKSHDFCQPCFPPLENIFKMMLFGAFYSIFE